MNYRELKRRKALELSCGGGYWPGQGLLAGVPTGVRLPPPPPFPFTRVTSSPQRLSQAPNRARLMSRYRPGPGSERPRPPAQLSLQLELPLSACASQPQNHEPSKRQRSRLSPARLAKFESMRVQRGTVLASCSKNSDANFLRQGHIFRLTPSLMSFIKADINAKRGTSASHASALPPLTRRKDLSLAKVSRMSEDEARDCFRQIRWAETEGKPVCPNCACAAVYSFRSRPIFKCKACEKQFSVSPGRSSPAASSPSATTSWPSRSSLTRSKAKAPWRCPAISTCNTKPLSSWPTKSAKRSPPRSKPSSRLGLSRSMAATSAAM